MRAEVGIVERVRVGSYAWCKDGDRVLLCRLSKQVSGAGRWTVPGGGVHFGEDPEAGLVRELGEETGLEGRIDGLIAVRSALLEPSETQSGDRLHVIGLLYRITVVGGALRGEADGSTDMAAWVPVADLDTLPAVPLLRWARAVAGG